MKGRPLTETYTKLLGHFLTACLVLSVLAKPVGVIFNQLSDTEQELFDGSNKNEQSEKEIDTDFENEKTVLRLDDLNTSAIYIYKVQNFSNLNENILGFKPSVQLPPPEA